MINLPEEFKPKAIGTFEVEGLEELLSLKEMAETHRLDWETISIYYGKELTKNSETAYENTRAYVNGVLERREG